MTNGKAPPPGRYAGVRRGVFLDRDGVLNGNVLYPDTGKYESPRSARDLSFLPGVAEAIRALRSRGYLLFVISNQPNYAKGKSSLAELEEIGATFRKTLEEWGVPLDGYYYCYHHPEGITPGFSGACNCRKPGTLFVELACQEFALDPDRSWMIGDRGSDILCGQAAGLTTILILEPTSADQRGQVRPDYFAPTLEAAVEIILRSQP